jgi:hypothetical protein
MYRLFAGRLTKMVLTIPRPDQQQSRSATMPISNNADQQQSFASEKCVMTRGKNWLPAPRF